METSLKKIKRKMSVLVILIIGVISISLINTDSLEELTIDTSSSVLSNKKIEWGIKRAENHE